MPRCGFQMPLTEWADSGQADIPMINVPFRHFGNETHTAAGFTSADVEPTGGFVSHITSHPNVRDRTGRSMAQHRVLRE